MKRNDWIYLISIFLFSLLFYQQQRGINFFLLSLALTAGTAWMRPGLVRKRNWLLAAAGTLFTGACVAWYGNALAVTAHLISLMLLSAMSMHPRSSVLVSLFLSLCSQGASYVFMILDSIERRRKRSQTANGSPGFKRVLLSLIVVLVVIVFFFMYRQSNVLFYEFTKNINLDFISIGWCAFTLLGAILLYGFYYNRGPVSVANWDAALPASLTPAAPETPPGFFDRLMSLPSERYSGILLFSLLNLLLLLLNGVDIAFLAGDQRLPEGVTFTGYLHQGVGMLIFSILCAMLIILYYFRGRLNFDGRYPVLRMLAIAWIVQNVFMLFSTSLRNSAYIAEYGLTYKRIGVYIYLLLSMIGLLVVAYKVARKKSNAYMFRVNGWLFYAVLALSPAVNWDRIITQFNLSVARHPDAAYVADLSYANYEELLMLKRKGLLDETAYGYSSMWSLGYRVNYNRNFMQDVFVFMENQQRTGWRSYCVNKQLVSGKLLTQPPLAAGDSILDVTDRDLETLPYFNLFGRISQINGAWNKIEKTTGLEKYRGLETLYLAGNRITDVSSIGKLAQLETLDLRGNPVKDYSPLFALKKLRQLYVSIDDGQQLERLQQALPQANVMNSPGFRSGTISED